MTFLKLFLFFVKKNDSVKPSRSAVETYMTKFKINLYQLTNLYLIVAVMGRVLPQQFSRRAARPGVPGAPQPCGARSQPGVALQPRTTNGRWRRYGWTGQ